MEDYYLQSCQNLFLAAIQHLCGASIQLIIKLSLSLPQQLHNENIYKGMTGDHLLLKMTAQVSQLISSHIFNQHIVQGLEIFGDPVLQSLIMTVYFWGKFVSEKEILIGLQWIPMDRKLP